MIELKAYSPETYASKSSSVPGRLAPDSIRRHVALEDWAQRRSLRIYSRSLHCWGADRTCQWPSPCPSSAASRNVPRAMFEDSSALPWSTDPQQWGNESSSNCKERRKAFSPGALAKIVAGFASPPARSRRRMARPRCLIPFQPELCGSWPPFEMTRLRFPQNL